MPKNSTHFEATILFCDFSPWSIKPMSFAQKRFLVVSGAIASGLILLNALFAWGEAYDDIAWHKTDSPSVARIVGGSLSRSDAIKSLLSR